MIRALETLSKIRSRFETIDPWIVFLACRMISLIFYQLGIGDDRAYFSAIKLSHDTGSPYGPSGFAYPPLAYLFVKLPSFFSGPDRIFYFKLYRAQCLILDALAFYLLSRRVKRPALYAWILLTSLLGSLLYNRFDSVVSLLLLATILQSENKKYASAGALFGISIALKIIPVVLLPAWLVWLSRTSIRNALTALGSMTGVLIAAVALGYLWLGTGSVEFLLGHLHRGTQIESTWASIQILVSQWRDIGLRIYWDAGSDNVQTTLAPILITLSSVLLVLAVVGVTIMGWRMGKRADKLAFVFACGITVCVFVSKVASPQYLILLATPIAVAFDDMSPSVRRAFLGVTLMVFALTSWVYPHYYEQLIDLRPIALIPSVLRNLFLGMLSVMFLAEGFPRART